MVEYEFNKKAIEEMYKDTCNECFEAMENGNIDDVKFEIKMGNQVIVIPTTADNLEEIFMAIKQCEDYY